MQTKTLLLVAQLAAFGAAQDAPSTGMNMTMPEIPKIPENCAEQCKSVSESMLKCVADGQTGGQQGGEQQQGGSRRRQEQGNTGPLGAYKDCLCKQENEDPFNTCQTCFKGENKSEKRQEQEENKDENKDDKEDSDFWSTMTKECGWKGAEEQQEGGQEGGKEGADKEGGEEGKEGGEETVSTSCQLAQYRATRLIPLLTCQTEAKRCLSPSCRFRIDGSRCRHGLDAVRCQRRSLFKGRFHLSTCNLKMSKIV